MDKQALLAIIMSVIAGLSTLIGGLIIFVKKYDQNKIINLALNFAAGVMITISIVDLIPSSLNMLNEKINISTSILLSILFLFIGIIMTKIINTKVHTYNNNNLYKVGIISMIAIILHNFPEDCRCYVSL